MHEFENTHAQLVYSIGVRAHSRVSGMEMDADKVEDGDVGEGDGDEEEEDKRAEEEDDTGDVEQSGHLEGVRGGRWGRVNSVAGGRGGREDLAEGF